MNHSISFIAFFPKWASWDPSNLSHLCGWADELGSLWEGKLYIHVFQIAIFQMLSLCNCWLRAASSNLCRAGGSHPRCQTGLHKSNTCARNNKEMMWRCFKAHCMLCDKMSVFFSLTRLRARSVPQSRRWICVYECVLFVVQCTIRAPSRMEAACTSAGWMAAEPTATVRLATSWQKTGRPAKVNGS